MGFMVPFLFLLAAIGSLAAEPPLLKMRLVEPALSDNILFNPGMGLYLAGGCRLSYQPPADAWALSLCDIVYFRPVWNDLEADGPGTGLDAYFRPIFDFWVHQRGKRVAFRVMSESMHSSSKYATPAWVFEQGVPGVVHRGLRGQEQIDPVFWDDRYLDSHCQFVERLGKYLDGREGLEFVDIGGIGEWGEMHLGLHIQGRWTPRQLEQTDFTRDKYVSSYRRVIDAHAAAFPRTRVFLNVGSYAEINDYAALRGCHFRQDGLTPRGPSANVGKRFYHPYSRRGVIGNYEFHSGYASMIDKGWDLATTVAEGLSDPISYLNTNILNPRAWEDSPVEVKQLFVEAARKIGFRFVLTKLQVPVEFHLDGKTPARLLVEHNWKNVGVAPCYESYALEFTVHDGQGRVVAQQRHFPHCPTTLWWPGEDVTERTLIRVDADAPPGDYELKVSMLRRHRRERRIRLGLAGRDEADRYHLCTVQGVATSRPTGVVYEQSFESEGHRWSVASGIEAHLDSDTFHGEKFSLRLSGNQQGSWNYAAHHLALPVLPASKYRLSCWLKVHRLEPAKMAPYLKIGLTDGDGRWLENCQTSRYNMAAAGSWQRLEGTLETPLETATGHLALERGGQEIQTRIQAWIDDVKLELLEAP
jgi:hypothetical protein